MPRGEDAGTVVPAVSGNAAGARCLSIPYAGPQGAAPELVVSVVAAMATVLAGLLVIVLVSLAMLATLTILAMIVAVPLGKVTRRVLLLVPAVLHEVNALTASVVVATVLAPVLGMPRRHAQIDGPLNHRHGPLDHGWPLRGR